MTTQLLERPVAETSTSVERCSACGHTRKDHQYDWVSEPEGCLVNGCDCPGYNYYMEWDDPSGEK